MSNGPEPDFESHETACILNPGDRDAHVREPAGPKGLTVPARRTRHQRFNAFAQAD